MSNILNPKPRFGYNESTGLIYDYVAQKDVTPIANYPTIDGSWNLLEVKRAILANETIEYARLTVKRPAPVAAPRAAAPTPAAKAPQPAAQPAPGFGVSALSVDQLQALKLSPLQQAAMGITNAQMNVTGVTALQVANWGLNGARADALALTPEQRAALPIQ